MRLVQAKTLLHIDISSRPLWFPYHFLKTQFKSLPYPDQDYNGQTVIVTGANVGLGLEAARHFTRLGAAKVILACRDPEKGRVARADIEASTSKKDVVEVWQVDMSSFQSVKDFCKRAETELDRLDLVVENAGVATGTYIEADGGFESTIAINVVSTFLMLLLLLPKLRRTASRFNKESKVVIVSSDAHLFVSRVDPPHPCLRINNVSHLREALDTLSYLLSRPTISSVLITQKTNSPSLLSGINPKSSTHTRESKI